MPRFSPTAISTTQLDDLIAYVDYTKHPDDAGGWSIGHLGPWPEGLVTWLARRRRARRRLPAPDGKRLKT